MSAGCNVHDLNVLPTPALQYAVKHLGLDGGLMITASHNPPEFNGIKAIDSDGTEMPREKEVAIEAIYFRRGFSFPDWKNVGTSVRSNGAITSYQKAVLANVDRKEIHDAGLKVVLDCANGAGSVCTPQILEELGVRTITLNCNPLGTFPGHPSEPTEDHLQDLKAMVRETGADLGIAHDGDADRTIFIDDKGNFIHGDRSLAIVAGAMVTENGGGIVVTPVSTSLCVEEVVKRSGGELVYTRVGAPIVARKMIELGALFGGEENGGLIFPKHQYCRDAAMTAAKMIEILAIEGKLSSLLEKVPNYCLDKRKLLCPDAVKEDVLKAVCEAFAKQRMDTTDGVKVYFDNGWTLIRPSGTEPIFRIYSEGKTDQKAHEIADRCENVVKEILDSISN